MDEKVIDIEDYEVKEKSIVVDDSEDESNQYTESANNNPYSDASYSSVAFGLSNGKLAILALVVIVLVAVFVLTFCWNLNV